MTCPALVLVNLGSTASTDIADVRRYLNQFLMDRHVIDLPWPLRRLIVSMVLRRRPAASAAAYRSIWWKEGSPLIVISKRLQQKMANTWNGPVELAMRYGEPSIEHVLVTLAQRGVNQVILAPLYPQFAASTVTTVIEELQRVVNRRALALQIECIPPFYDQPAYIAALGESARGYLARGYDHLLLSYHGLPEGHIHKADPTGCHCLSSSDCCQRADAAVLGRCYRAQCVRTSERLIQQLSVPKNRWSMAFQSRLGRTKWIDPYTDATIARLGAKGIKKLLVMCPAFVADCIETLEEIAIRGRESFRAAGGEELVLIPCLNDQPQWVAALASLCRDASRQVKAA